MRKPLVLGLAGALSDDQIKKIEEAGYVYIKTRKGPANEIFTLLGGSEDGPSTEAGN